MINLFIYSSIVPIVKDLQMQMGINLTNFLKTIIIKEKISADENYNFVGFNYKPFFKIIQKSFYCYGIKCRYEYDDDINIIEKANLLLIDKKQDIKGKYSIMIDNSAYLKDYLDTLNRLNNEFLKKNDIKICRI